MFLPCLVSLGCKIVKCVDDGLLVTILFQLYHVDTILVNCLKQMDKFLDGPSLILVMYLLP